MYLARTFIQSHWSILSKEYIQSKSIYVFLKVLLTVFVFLNIYVSVYFLGIPTFLSLVFQPFFPLAFPNLSLVLHMWTEERSCL